MLHSGKPAPANRFSNWIPRAFPFGDKANRQSDGALTMIRLRDDFGATFDLTGIPVLSNRPSIIEPHGDIIGTVGATPTNMLTETTNTAVVALQRASGAPGDYGYNGLIAKHTLVGATGTAVGYFPFTGVNGRAYTGQVAVYIPSAFVGSDVTLQIENGGNVSAVVIGHADLTKRDQWQILTASATLGVIVAPYLVLRVSATAPQVLYSDLWLLDDPTVAAVRMVDLADRLAYHLENGGTCQVDTGDYEGNSYATCGLAPGATASPPVLSDKKNLEYTLSLSLVNLAGSPARMRCHYL